MKFSFNNNIAKLYSKDVNVVQQINPFTQEKIDSREKALDWAKKYIKIIHDASLIYITVESDEETFSVNTEYIFKLKESTNRLTGKYTIEIKNNEYSIFKEVDFIDGYADFKIIFNKADEYEFLLENDFYIGQDKYISLVDESYELATYSFNSIERFRFLVRN